MQIRGPVLPDAAQARHPEMYPALQSCRQQFRIHPIVADRQLREWLTSMLLVHSRGHMPASCTVAAMIQ